MADTQEFKVVVAGPFASGKTTLIQAISQTRVVGTEQPTTGSEAAVKDTTTVGMEFGTYAIGDDDLLVTLSLYGVPGQERFAFMWDIVGVGMDGLVLVVDATQPDTWDEARQVVRHFTDRHDRPIVVAVNRAEPGSPAVDLVRDAIPVDGASYLACDVTDVGSARGVLVEVLVMVLDELAADPADELVG